MNIAMEQTEEYVNGQLKEKYGDAFIRGNNGAALCVCFFFFLIQVFSLRLPHFPSFVYQHPEETSSSIIKLNSSCQVFTLFVADVEDFVESSRQPVSVILCLRLRHHRQCSTPRRSDLQRVL